MQVEKKTVKRGTRKKAVRHRWSGTVVPKQGLSHGQAGRNQLLPGFSGANVVRQPHQNHCLPGFGFDPVHGAKVHVPRLSLLDSERHLDQRACTPSAP